MPYVIIYVQVSQHYILSLPVERLDSYLELPRKEKYISNET